MSFLLDTNVLSELVKRQPNPKVLSWFGSVAPADLFLSVITLGEVRKGIELKRERDPANVARYEAWLEGMPVHYGSRILPFDHAVADHWGRIMARHPTLPVEDGQLAATALRHGLTLVTRNVRHLAPTEVPYLNPF